MQYKKMEKKYNGIGYSIYIGIIWFMSKCVNYA